MHEQYHKWYSQYLSRDMEMLVFGKTGLPIILFTTEKGRYYETKDFGIISSVENLIDEGKIKIYCPDSIDAESWYNYEINPADRIKKHLLYEESLIKDVIDFALYETENKKCGISGISFGGYHALNIAFKHPDKISSLVTLCGFFDIKQFIYGFYNEDCYFNNPFDYLPNLTDEWFLNRIKEMKIILGSGEWDFCLDDNVRMNAILNSKGIENRFDVRKYSGHDWNWWREMFPDYINNILV